jgi:hypothetical protein
MKTRPTSFALLALAFAFLPPSFAAEFTIEQEADGVVVKIDGQLFTKYVTADAKANKPFFYPVIGPTGKEMTRAYPMKDVEGEKQDHPHHRSFWFGHQFINDFDTWHEELTLIERAKGDPAKLRRCRREPSGRGCPHLHLFRRGRRNACG